MNRVLLAGVGRSGTTWTGRILGCAADTAYMNEPDNIGITHTDGPIRDTMGFGAYPVLAAGQHAPQYAALWRMAYAGRLPMRVGIGRTVARLGLKLPTAVRDPLLTVFAGAVEGAATTPKNVVVKSTMTPFALEWIVEQFQPRVVIIQRNPLNVVSSWLDWKKFIIRDLSTRPAVGEAYRQLVGEDMPPVGDSHLARTAWSVGLLTTVLARRLATHPEWHLVTHETICGDPTAGFHQLFADLGLTWTNEADRFLEKGYLMPTFAGPGQVAGRADPREVTKEQANRWKMRLTEDQVAEIEDVLARFPSRGWVRARETAQAG